MDKKQIQEERMKGYFIESAKNLLKGEGLRSISVRHVADHAGYSYATLYNYFKDLNELIFICVGDFQQEAEEFIARKTEKTAPGKERIQAIAQAYIDYFIEYPGVYELFFLERMRDFNSKKEISELIYTFLDRLCADDWAEAVKQGVYTEERTELLKAQLRFSLAGMLLYYENRLQPDNYEAFVKQARQQIEAILEARG